MIPDGPPEQILEGPGGLPLFLRRFGAEDPAAIFLFVHGLGAHSGWYAPMGRELARLGIASYAFDLPGHGRSGGPRGDVPDGRVVYDSIEQVLALAARETRAPLFAGGLSLGALLVLRRALSPDARVAGGVPVRGYVALSPPIADRYIPLPVKAGLLALLPLRPTRRYGCPVGLGVPITCDVDANAAAAADPLALQTVTLRTYYLALRATLAVVFGAGRIRAPTLILTGARDRVVRVGATSWFFRRLGSREKRLAVYPDLGHDLKLEPAMPRVARDIARWIREVLEVAGGAPKTC